MKSSKIDIPSRKAKEHDNDEGFEETQSLMSESPSQGASSGGNYETDLVDSSQIVVAEFTKTKPIRALSLESKGTIDSTTSSETHVPSTRTTRSPPKSTKMQTASAPKQPRPLERTTSLRKTSQELANKKSVIPRRSESLRKSDAKTVAPPPAKSSSIQKSNSRNSIVSSRSSLNSATSTSTVKKLPVKPNTNNLNRPVQRTPSTKSINSAGKTNLRRTTSNSSNISNKPPRPQPMSFMKPTTSSSTRSTTSTSTARTSSFRSKNV